jgi:hypothetical protein
VSGQRQFVVNPSAGESTLLAALFALAPRFERDLGRREARQGWNPKDACAASALDGVTEGPTMIKSGEVLVTTHGIYAKHNPSQLERASNDGQERNLRLVL